MLAKGTTDHRPGVCIPLKQLASNDAPSCSNTCWPLHGFLSYACAFLVSQLQQQKGRYDAEVKHLYNKMEKRRSSRKKIGTFLPLTPASKCMLRKQHSQLGCVQRGQGWKQTQSNPGLISKGCYFTPASQIM